MGGMMTIDKQAHFWAGAAIAATVSFYTADPLLGLVVGVAAGVAKELYDLSGRGVPDIKDLIVTALGATVVVPALLL